MATGLAHLGESRGERASDREALATVEEASFLGAVNGVICRVQVQHHLAQWPRVRVKEGVDEAVLEGLSVVDDLAVARLRRRLPQAGAEEVSAGSEAAARAGVTVADLINANQALQQNPDFLSIGQSIYIP